jgi:hypothetical protein
MKLHWMQNSIKNHLQRSILVVCCLVCLGWLVSNPGIAQPVEPIIIVSPGDGSVVTAPIELTAMVQPGADGLVRVSLFDKQGELLARQVMQLSESNSDALEWTTQLAFEIPGESAPAILVVTTMDHAQRPIAVRTAGLSLQRAGYAKIEPTDFTGPWLQIDQPEHGTVIDTSPLVVRGQVRPINDYPVIFSLVTERGGAIVARQLAVETPGEPINFEIVLPFTPTSTIRNMRLTIRQGSKINGVYAILDSLPISIEP